MAELDRLLKGAIGRRGRICQEGGRWQEAYCFSAEEDSLTLQPLDGRGLGRIDVERSVTFILLDDSGVLRVKGRLSPTIAAITSGRTQQGWKLSVFPGEAVRENRRSFFRVPLSQTAMIVTSGDEKLSKPPKTHPCRVTDLSVGGCCLSMPSPPLHAGDRGRLTFELASDGHAIELPILVLASEQRVMKDFFDSTLRVKFTKLSEREEERLSRFVNWAQLEKMRKGE